MPHDKPRTWAGGRVLAAALLVTFGCRAPTPPEDPGPPPSVEEAPPIEELRLKSKVERKLVSRAVDRYKIFLEAGEYLHLAVEQQDVDVEVVIFDSASQLLLAVDSPNGVRGDEHLFFLAEDAGEYRVKIRAAGGTGFYALRVVAQRLPTAEDRLRVEAALAQGEGNRLRTTDLPTALAHYQKALKLWRRLGDRAREAMALVRSGQVQGQRGQREEQLRSYEEALRLLRGQGLVAQQIFAWLELGTARGENAEPAAALGAFEQALSLAREIEDRSEEATALNNMALLLEREGRMQEALTLFRQVFVLYEGAGRRDWAALALRNLGFVHILLGQLEEARETLDRALRYQEPGDLRGKAVVLLHLGWIDYLEEQPSAALERYAEALALSRTARDRANAAGALDRQGTVYLALGRVDEALLAHREALAIFREIGQLQAAAHVEANLGWLYLHRGDLERAARFFEPPLRAFRSGSDSHGEASTLYLGARIARRQGRLDEARGRVEEVLRIVESHRLASTDRAVRIRYLSSRYEYYEFYIDLLMELEASEPGQGHAAAAVDAVERSRARSLLEQLTRAGVRREVPAPLGLARIQHEMLDEQTLLLVYSLGRERSFVWAVTSSSMTSHILAPADRIEGLATRYHRSLSRSQASASRMQAELAAVALSEELLAPVTSRLVRDKIVVMADGALHLVPFGALPNPDPAGKASAAPLIAEHEVVYVPSASVMMSLRRSAAPPGRGVAVLADPPFSRADPRVPASTVSVRAASGFGRLDRLDQSGREAEEIRALVPRGTPHLEALGFEARRELVVGGELNGYAILHFATHGLLHTEHPERSGLVLSMFDQDGQPIDGTFRVREIYDLELSADLVVLSACRTALGRRFRGEGVLGLPRAFMYAGVPRVVVSLWDVGDEATADLMQRFYRGVLQEGLSPAAALREAQLSLLAERRWQAPFYWAAFVLQGDWR